MPLGPAIPTRFEAESAARLRALSKKLKMDEADLIRRAVDVTLNTIDSTGDYRFLIEAEPLPLTARPFRLARVLSSESDISKVAEDPPEPPSKRRTR